MNSAPHFLADVVFYSRENGGRFTPPQSGYHPQIMIGEESTSSIIESVNGERVLSFNVHHTVHITLMFPDIYRHRFNEELSFGIYEGEHLVGNGKIVKVNPTE
jgi:translation elongation factor EF-Tu-like GTPase